ncbi:MAG: hypothetical protein HY275_08110 [Gemmatimonadetes bacterium]|nr:hypothetical protein [Gemmatimonadota bacterium]
MGGTLSAARTDSSLELSLVAVGAYQDNQDPGTAFFVARRSGRAVLSLEHRPHDLWSPVLWLSAEGSLEAQVASRYEQGLGLKLTPLRDSLGSASLSLAVVHTATNAFANAPANPDAEVLRWSLRFKAARELLDRKLDIATVTFWRPLLRDASHYTASSRTTIAWRLTPAFAVNTVFVYEYDTEAPARGATSPEYGSLSFGLRYSFRSAGR